MSASEFFFVWPGAALSFGRAAGVFTTSFVVLFSPAANCVKAPNMTPAAAIRYFITLISDRHARILPDVLVIGPNLIAVWISQNLPTAPSDFFGEDHGLGL